MVRVANDQDILVEEGSRIKACAWISVGRSWRLEIGLHCFVRNDKVRGQIHGEVQTKKGFVSLYDVSGKTNIYDYGMQMYRLTPKEEK